MEKEAKLLTELGTKSLLIEKMTSINMEQAIPLFRSAYNGLAPWYEFYSKEKARRVLSRYQEKEGFQLLVAKADDDILGMAIVTNGRQASLPGSLFLQEIFVDPNYQQSPYRVGSSLLREVIENAMANGYKAIQLQTDARNIQAVRLYRKFGFIEGQDSQEKRITQRTFTKLLDNSLEIASIPLMELPNDLNRPFVFFNQNELRGYLFSQCMQPGRDENLTLFQGTLDLIIQRAIKDGLTQRRFYDRTTNTWSTEGQASILSISASDMKQLVRFTRFILSIQRLNKRKTSGNEMNTLVEKCFALKDPKERLNIVCFVCASYDKNFSGVSSDTNTNRLRFFLSDMKELEKAIEVFEGRVKITLFFADTDYEIYPIEKSQDNLANYQRQYEELRDFCRQNFNPRFVRIIPWSVFQGRFKNIYSSNLQKALPLSEDTVDEDLYLPEEKRGPRSKQIAVYAAQAATLPKNSVMLIMEPSKFNKDYDLLFQNQTSIPSLPKLQVFDVGSYKKWTDGMSR